MFEWYAWGDVSTQEVTKKARAAGLVFRKSCGRIPKSTVAAILRNRIYTGRFDWDGKTWLMFEHFDGWRGRGVIGLAEVSGDGAEYVGTAVSHGRRSKPDSFRRALLRKVMAYALGRSLTLGDVGVADALVPALRKREDRLPALIELIVASEPFQSK